MRKIAIALIMLLSVSFLVQSDENRDITVGVWANAENNSVFNTRLKNEIVSKLENSEEFSFDVSVRDTSADFHLNVYGMTISGMNAYAWSISVVPIFSPQFNTATAATSEASISGVNWIARQSVKFLVEHIYVMKDRAKQRSKDNNQTTL